MQKSLYTFTNKGHNEQYYINKAYIYGNNCKEMNRKAFFAICLH